MNIREDHEFGEGATVNEMAVANDNETVPEPLPAWFDLIIVACLVGLAVIVFAAIYWVLT